MQIVIAWVEETPFYNEVGRLVPRREAHACVWLREGNPVDLERARAHVVELRKSGSHVVYAATYVMPPTEAEPLRLARERALAEALS